MFKEIEYYKTIVNIKDKPENGLPEFAFAGRSNVGKSSLLNAIFQRRNIARVSKDQGKTRTINYFLINKRFYCVDLPGYGFAKVSKTEQNKWKKMIESYLLNNQSLKNLFLLIDSRHDLMLLDKQMIEWIDFIKLPYTIVLSKTDKLKKNELARKIHYFKEYIPDDKIFVFSVKNKKSIENLQRYIFSLFNSL